MEMTYRDSGMFYLPPLIHKVLPPPPSFDPTAVGTVSGLSNSIFTGTYCVPTCVSARARVCAVYGYGLLVEQQLTYCPMAPTLYTRLPHGSHLIHASVGTYMCQGEQWFRVRVYNSWIKEEDDPAAKVRPV